MQVLQREKDVADLEAMHRAVTAQLEQRQAHVEARLAKETDRCRQLEHRCAQRSLYDYCGLPSSVASWSANHLMIFLPSTQLLWKHAEQPCKQCSQMFSHTRVATRMLSTHTMLSWANHDRVFCLRQVCSLNLSASGILTLMVRNIW